VKDGKKLQHDGIRLELVGSIGEDQSIHWISGAANSRSLSALC
jgi:hypothetical protein